MQLFHDAALSDAFCGSQLPLTHTCLSSLYNTLPQDGPDELSALLYVALLAQALLRLTAEKRAALTIVDFLRRRMMWRPGALGISAILFYWA